MRAMIIKLLVRILDLFPLSLLHGLGTTIGFLLYKLPNRNRSIASRNIELCFPSLNAQEQEALIKSCLVETSKTAMEVAAMLLWNRQRILSLIKEIHGLEILQRAYNENRGVIIALPHLGSWELVGLFCSMHYPSTSLYSPLNIPALNDFVQNARQRFGATLVATDRKGIRVLVETLKQRNIVLMLPDQDPGPGRQGSIFVPFFGLPANTMTLLPRLANKTKSKVMLAYAERLPKGRGFELHFKELSAAICDPDIENATRYLNQIIEHLVRRIPNQYQWTYKRFKNRPNNQEKLY